MGEGERGALGTRLSRTGCDSISSNRRPFRRYEIESLFITGNRHCFSGTKGSRRRRRRRSIDARVGSFGEREGKRCFRFVAPRVTKALIARGVKRRIRGGGATLFRQVQPFSTVDEDVPGNLSFSTGGFGFLGGFSGYGEIGGKDFEGMIL